MTDNKTNKLSPISILLWVLVIVWMGVIFSFSAENGNKSAQTSGKITEKAASEIIENYDTLGEKEKDSALSVVSIVVRKLGHFTEFFILGALLTAAFSSRGGISLKKFGLSLIICFLYALSDEFHQKFVDGRSPALRCCDRYSGRFFRNFDDDRNSRSDLCHNKIARKENKQRIRNTPAKNAGVFLMRVNFIFDPCFCFYFSSFSLRP